MIKHLVVGVALAGAVAATPAACAGTGSSASSTLPVTTTPAKTVTNWVVLWGGSASYARDPNNPATGQYSVYCRNGAAGWREVAIPASEGKAAKFTKGTPCPAGTILGASGCDQNGHEVNATDTTAAGEGDEICPQLQNTTTA